MKTKLKKLLPFIVWILVNSLSAQTMDEPGTLFLTDGHVITGTIEMVLRDNTMNVQVSNNSTDIHFYDAKKVEKVTCSDGRVFIGKKIEVQDQDSIDVFIECLFGGDIGLYSYVEADLNERFYLAYNEDQFRELKIEEKLVYGPDNKTYKKTQNKYIGELKYALSNCDDSNFSKSLLNSKLNRRSLSQKMVKYYKCTNETYWNSAKVNKNNILFDLEVMSGLEVLRTQDGDTYWSDYSFGFVGVYYLPKTYGRYSVGAGYSQTSYQVESASEKTNLQLISFHLNRYFTISKQMKFYVRSGIEIPFALRKEPVWILFGGGVEYEIAKTDFKIFTNFTSRFLPVRRSGINLGVKYQFSSSSKRS